MVAKSLAALVASAAILAGCTSTIHRTVDIDNGTGLSVDAKQRLLLVTEKGGLEDDKRVVCAEPSPDAITSIAASASASGGTPEIGVSLGFGSSEAAASIGLRTQTIQLLRDGYYRLCEAYMNGALSREQYNFALVKIDHLIVPLMAIDAIAGTPRPPAVVIAPGNPGSSSSTSIVSELLGGGEGGTDEQTASSEGSASVGATAASLQIETTNHARVGLSKDETEVLKEALKLVSDSSPNSLCVSYLADGDYLRQPVNQNQVSFQAQLASHCSSYLKLLFDAETEKLRAKLKKTADELDEKSKALEKTKGKLGDESKKATAVVKEVQAQQVKMAKDLADKALENPKVIIE